MASPIRDRLRHAWNVFRSDEESEPSISRNFGASYGISPARTRLRVSNERSIVASIYNRLGMDIAAVEILHVRLDENDNFLKEINSGLNNCLKLEANIDQGGRAFRQDMAMSLFDKGVIAVVPAETSVSPNRYGGFDIKSLRVGEIVSWYPRHVRILLYNDILGKKQEVTLPKSYVAIVENPLYSVMNEPNSTHQRLIRKLNMLDAVDEASSSGKLDVIIQLPYVIKTETKRAQAEERAKDIEVQLRGSKYGIAYTDGTERITQLNRPAENNLLSQIQFLTAMLYGQLGITEAVFDGTADEKTMVNYYNRTIEPVLGAISEGLNRAFLTKTARGQRQTIKYIRDPFKLVSAGDIAELSDKLTRNEIVSSNEMRGFIGMRPSKDPKANQLINKNIPEPVDPPSEPAPTKPSIVEPDGQPDPQASQKN